MSVSVRAYMRARARMCVCVHVCEWCVRRGGGGGGWVGCTVKNALLKVLLGASNNMSLNSE